MATNYPAAADDNTTLPNPGTGAYTNSPSHLGLHGNANDAIKALEAKVGIGASTPPGGGFIFTSSSAGVGTWQAAPVSAVWGLITGTLSNQTDLSTALNARVQLGSDISGTVTAPLVLTSNGVAIVTTTGAQTLTNKILTAATATADPVANLGIATKQYVDALGSTTLVRNETPGGTVNGANTAFTTAATFGTGSLKVYLNGQRLAPGSGIDFIEGTQAFTMQYAPATGDVLLVDYETTNTTRFIQGSNSIIVNETPTGTVNGSTTLFTVLQGKYVANTLEVFLNGVQQLKTTDFTETTPGSGTFTFVAAPVTGDAVRVSYQFATGASGNADTVDGIHASATATANQLMALDSNGKFATTLLTNPYKFSVYRAAAFNSGTAAFAIINFDTKTFDTGSNVDIVTNKGRFTAPVAGFYSFSASASVGGGAGGSANHSVLVALFKNGSQVIMGSTAPTWVGTVSTTVSGLLQLAANDYIEVYCFGDVALTMATGTTTNQFSGFLVSAT